MENQETMLEYVRRKLQSKAFNNAAAVRSTKLGKATISEIASGKNPNPQFDTVQKLYDYFQELAK